MLGQIVHNGDWDATPHGVPNLLKTIDQSTTLHVQFKRVPVDPGEGRHLQLPRAFHDRPARVSPFSETRNASGQYLDHGGTLVVDCAIGSEFDTAFRKEIKEIYPDQRAQAPPGRSPDAQFVFDSRRRNVTPLAQQLDGAT